MEKYLTNYFNNGDNDGDVTIVSNDDKTIKCHSFVLKYTCEYAKSLWHFDQQPRTINLDFDSEIITKLLNRLYTESYPIKDLDSHEIIEFTNLRGVTYDAESIFPLL